MFITRFKIYFVQYVFQEIWSRQTLLKRGKTSCILSFLFVLRKSCFLLEGSLSSALLDSCLLKKVSLKWSNGPVVLFESNVFLVSSLQEYHRAHSWCPFILYFEYFFLDQNWTKLWFLTSNFKCFVSRDIFLKLLCKKVFARKLLWSLYSICWGICPLFICFDRSSKENISEKKTKNVDLSAPSLRCFPCNTQDKEWKELKSSLPFPGVLQLFARPLLTSLEWCFCSWWIGRWAEGQSWSQ